MKKFPFKENLPSVLTYYFHVSKINFVFPSLMSLELDRASLKHSVRPNTEYSAEYSAEIGRIFGTEYSAKVADTPIPKKRRKFANFCHFLPKIQPFFPKNLLNIFTFV